MIELFKYYQEMQSSLPYISLGNFPTLLRTFKNLSDFLGLNNLYLKDDGLSGDLYGGNKVRKLEFLLGDALKNNCSTVMTFGCAGSNHALATASYCRKLGLKSLLMLFPQENSFHVQKNILTDYFEKAEMYHYDDYLTMVKESEKIIEGYKKRGENIYIIPAGGSSALGVLGFVNAAFELYSQIKNSEVPLPDMIFVPLGTAGTLAGLVIGCKALKIKTKIVGVRVVDKEFMSKDNILSLCESSLNLLKESDKNFPNINITEDDFLIEDGFLGKGYGFTEDKSSKAADILKQTEKINLEQTYTAKNFGAFLKYAKENPNKNMLFWNTLNGVDITEKTSKIDFRNLPKTLHRYFI